MREENRAWNALRNIRIEKGYAPHNASVIFHIGNTAVHCSAYVEEKVPKFVEEGSGWMTAEYSLLPFSTGERARRERGSKIGGRTMEIQRLIGRSLRGIANLKALGPRSILLDCDVLKADGGTRCASICGSYLALSIALQQLEHKGLVDPQRVLPQPIAAISVGIVKEQLLLDLEYKEDSIADVDMNLIMTSNGTILEIQGTAEKNPFSIENLNKMVTIGHKAIQEIIEKEQAFLTKYHS